MTTNTEYLLALGIVSVGFSAPAISTLASGSLLVVLDNLVIRVLLGIALLLAIMKSYLIGIAVFVAIGLLFIERNRSKVRKARDIFLEKHDAHSSPLMSVEEEGKPQTTVKVLDFEEADGRETTYLPGKNVGSDDFRRVPWSESLDDKRVLPTVPIGNKSAPLFANYLG